MAEPYHRLSQPVRHVWLSVSRASGIALWQVIVAPAVTALTRVLFCATLTKPSQARVSHFAPTYNDQILLGYNRLRTLRGSTTNYFSTPVLIHLFPHLSRCVRCSYVVYSKYALGK